MAIQQQVDTEALDDAVSWLVNHRRQVETMVRVARTRAEVVLSEAYQVPGAAANYRQYLDDFTHSATCMVQDLEAIVTFLQGVSHQYGGTSSPKTQF